jgi:Lon protease-like protein
MKIGLFPIGLVLFPQSLYPLHIFEDRYKELINECIDNDLEFGINLVSNTKMHDIGCTAKVVDVFKRYEDGRMDITVEGVRKYRLLSFTEGERSFYTGQIEYENDFHDNVEEDLLSECIKYFNKIINKIQGFQIDKIDSTKLYTKYPAFFIAQKAGLTPEQKQILLELIDENTRLEFILKHLKRITPLVDDVEEINKIIKYDGYLKPKFLK